MFGGTTGKGKEKGKPKRVGHIVMSRAPTTARAMTLLETHLTKGGGVGRPSTVNRMKIPDPQQWFYGMLRGPMMHENTRRSPTHNSGPMAPLFRGCPPGVVPIEAPDDVKYHRICKQTEAGAAGLILAQIPEKIRTFPKE